MYRFTTPTHIFRLPFDVSLCQDILITYAQQGKIVLEKALSELASEGKTVQFTFTQQETAEFKKDLPCKVQMKVLTNDGKVLASREKEIKICTVLNESIMGDTDVGE